MFLTNLSSRFQKDEFPSETGSAFRDVYAAKYDESGLLFVDKVGEVNRFKEIQAYADSVDVNNILQRFRLGDDSALKAVQGFYGDVSELPNSAVDYLNMIETGRQYFENLPASVKEVFDNSFTEFLVKSTDPDFLNSFNTPAPVSTSDVPIEEGE